MRIHLVLAITSPSAFLEVNGTPSLIHALEGLRSFRPSLPITVAVALEDYELAKGMLRAENSINEILVCEPLIAKAFAESLAPNYPTHDALMIHDASRPLTSHEQMERVLIAFTNQVDAVRPAIAFTETLKILSANSVIAETLDRTAVHRISTPELIRVSAIDLEGQDCGWFLPLKTGARREHIEGTPLGQRINTVADRDLMELFLD